MRFLPARINAVSSRLALFCLLLFCPLGEPIPPVFTLALGGDVMLGRGVAQSLDGDWQAAFAQVRPWLAGADLAFANLESPLTTMPHLAGGYDLRAAPGSVAALRLAGFDLLSLANNHSLDAGASGRAETLATLNAAGIAGVVEHNAGALVSRGGPHPTLGYQLLAVDDTVAPLDVETAGRAVAAAAQQAELVVVSVHWGGEYQAAPSPRQRAIAKALAQAGADLVVGHGPHVLQPVEWEGETLVAYSLGNLLFDQPYPADCRRGVILRVTCSASCAQLSVEFVPTVVERGRVRPAHAESRSAILARLVH